MDGDDILLEEFHAPNSGWKDAIKEEYAMRKALSLAVQPLQNQPGKTDLAAKKATRGTNSPRLPKLPKDVVWVVLRLRGGIQLKPGDCVALQRSIRLAANVTGGNAARDTFRLNEQQNTLLFSTQNPENAARCKVATYVVPPDNTQRGIIQCVPQEESEQDIPENLVYNGNSSVLHARRMKCKLLYKTPHILVKRKWDRLKQDAERRTPFQPKSIDFPPLPPASRSRGRTPAKRRNPRIPSRSRSRGPTRESKDKTANNSRNSSLSDLLKMVTQLCVENRWLLNRPERTERECANFDSNCKLGRHPRRQIQKQHPYLEALRPRPFNRKCAKPLPKCCRTQGVSPVSPHNSTASGRHRLTRKNTKPELSRLRKKRGNFQQHVNALPAEDRPDLIALYMSQGA
ncbi:hypothetical protein HPB47_001468 [Ixodes persulcatus]|uniref:Uncharacterized protein n=1 Tax=Ixodes persulcatus TaxID=34615 RepID=A0AC60PPP1_IXOPE|nr:hypothetical protein HPB47_001468 [Ixodes persulcatus]